MRDKTTIHVLVVGQTPPPWHGQAVMIQAFLEGEYRRIRLHHVRMAFSEDLNLVGKFRIRKILHLVSVVAAIIAKRILHKATVLYYPPAGPNLVPFIRDSALLISTRWMFKKTVFHFHAAGLSLLFPRLPPLLKRLYKLGYSRPDLAITTSRHGIIDAEFIEAKTTCVVPCGLPDRASSERYPKNRVVPPTIAFMGMVCEEKGVDLLLDACLVLRSQKVPFKVEIAGEFRSPDEKAKYLNHVEANGLADVVKFVGLIRGDEKNHFFERADIFCFPTFYSSESFGIVVIEAMMFGLPVVCSDWRALPEIVKDGVTGFVVPANNIDQLAQKLHQVLTDQEMAYTMGKEGRTRYEQMYTVDVFRKSLETAIAGNSHSHN